MDGWENYMIDVFVLEIYCRYINGDDEQQIKSHVGIFTYTILYHTLLYYTISYHTFCTYLPTYLPDLTQT